MKKHDDKTLRIKRKHLIWLQESRGLSPSSVDKAAASIDRFTSWLGNRALKAFHIDWARGFKQHLDKATNPKTGKALSAVTVAHTLRNVKGFFGWLADQPGYKSRIRHTEVEYFNPPKRTAKRARGTTWQPHASPEQLRHVLTLMPTSNVLERRDRAVVAFLFLTGCRDGAAATIRLANVDLNAGCVHFKGPEIETKFGKVFTTWFLPVGGPVRQVLEDWVRELRHEHLWGPDDPLFPRTKVGLGPGQRFQPLGLDRAPWSNGTRICNIYRDAFVSAGLPGFDAHSIRHTLTELGSQLCGTIEEMKAWSQNVGHEDVMTTLRSYGTVASGRQAELLRRMRKDKDA